jgi:hypothetical protein
MTQVVKKLEPLAQLGRDAGARVGDTSPTAAGTRGGDVTAAPRAHRIDRFGSGLSGLSSCRSPRGRTPPRLSRCFQRDAALARVRL